MSQEVADVRRNFGRIVPERRGPAPVRDQAEGLRLLAERRLAAPRRIAITGGRDGAERTRIAINVAAAMGARGRRVVLVDGESIPDGISLALGLPWGRTGPAPDGADRDPSVPVVPGVRVVTGGAGVERLQVDAGIAAELGAADAILYSLRWESLPAVALDEAAVVTTPQPESVTDAYAGIKSVVAAGSAGAWSLVVTGAGGRSEAEVVGRAMAATARRFLGLRLELLGEVPEDTRLAGGVRWIVLEDPSCEASRGLFAITDRFLERVPRRDGPSEGKLWRRISAAFGL
ncbi:MAG: hypothetical protein HY716_02985 [Planctomycetes bacterium]|nr:hypothetical protein [Planctomycetota bacterium]